MTSTTVNAAVRNILARYGNLSVDIATLTDEADLSQAGLASHATINIMLALEDELNVEFPDALMSRSTFESIASIEAAVATLKSVGA